MTLLKKTNHHAKGDTGGILGAIDNPNKSSWLLMKADGGDVVQRPRTHGGGGQGLGLRAVDADSAEKEEQQVECKG